MNVLRGTVRVAAPLATVAIALALWVIMAWALRGRELVPWPIDMLTQFFTDGELLLGAAVSTLETAAVGFGIAVLIVLPLAAIGLVMPVSEPVIMRVAIVVHVMPTVAIATVITVAMPGDAARVAITVLSVYFPLLVGVAIGLKAADTTSLEVVVASGGRSIAQLLFVRLPAALPSLFDGLKVAAPAAVLGAMLSEFFGAERGLGAILITAQESLLLERTWAIAILGAAISAIAFGVIALLSRMLLPWARERNVIGTDVADGGDSRLTPRLAAVGVLISVLVIVGGWQSLTTVFGLDPYFTKSPADVIGFLIAGNPYTGAGAGVFWNAFLPALGVTLLHAFVGFVVGTGVAVGLAALMAASDGAYRAIMPFAILLRSVPLLAMTPLIVLLFGRNLVGVTVIVTIVVFFPTLVTVIGGLQATPVAAVEIVRAAGGGSLSTVLHVRVPYAVPALLASARIAVPAAIGGATLAEWLATGDGLGYFLTASAVLTDYYTVWAIGVLLVVVSLLVYAALGVGHKLTLRRLGLDG